MKVFTVVAALSFALLTVPAFAQQKPTTQKPPATTQKPTTPATPQKPAITPPPQAQAQPPRPFPEGAKIAYCSLNRIAQESREGKASFQKVTELADKLRKGIDDKNKAMQANQALINSPAVDDAKRASLQKEVERQQVELQRMQQDAQGEIQDLQNQLQQAFSAKLYPVVNTLATEKGLHMILVQEDAGIYWADTGLDLTAEIVKRLDSTSGPSTPKNPGGQQQ